MLALVLAIGGGIAVAAKGAADRQAEHVREVAAAVQREARTAAEVRRDRGGTDGFQDPMPARSAPASKARPERVIIPSIHVDSTLERLHRDDRGVLAAPEYADQAGWWAEGVVPGRVGAAVIVGHLDTIQGDAVFVDLRRLRPGDRIDVRMSDGSTVRYTVDRTHVVDKALFPSTAVYGSTPDPQLRLITCSEPFDHEAHSYTDNLVVYASEHHTP